ncbi:SurA N-terminal domain-containing protein [Salinisphaera sp. SPP-AMP-43]|uniref:SurA N-terminal domain-containing protein n=1 Tax=Salinisphaera sp. SPP-AMP-43 TaxID=3121288 RepID=UPI003C6DBD58
MLQKIRDGSSGPLAYVVVAVIAVVFGVWGIGSYFTPSSDPVVASVGDTEITHSQLQRAFNQRYQRLQQMMGDNFDSDMFPSDRIRQNVLDNLIGQAVMTQYAKDAGYRVTDGNLLSQIRNNPQFQENGQFSPQRYKALLGQAGMQPSQYEARLRQGMMGGQVRQVVAGTAFAAAPEVDAAYRQAHEQRQVSVLSFDASAFAEQVNVDDAAIKTYYDKHAQQFMRPPRVKLAYVSLDADQLGSAAPDRDTLQQLYEAHKDELGSPAKRSADAVRIPIQGGNDTQARNTVQAVLKAAKNGRSLKAIAADTENAHYQQIDNQSRSALGDTLGTALFGLDNGALSNPVRGQSAWYVLRTTAITPAKTPDFDDPVVQARLKAMARQQGMAKAFRAKSEQLDDLAYQAPNGLQTISEKLGLDIQHSGWISPEGGNGLGQYDAVRQAAFSDAVLKDKLNSNVLDLGDQRRVVLRVAEHQDAQEKSLSEVRQSIRDRLVQQKAQQRARKAAQQVQAKAEQGQDSLSELASAQQGASLKQPGYIERNNNALDAQIVSAAFRLPLGDKSSQEAAYKVVSTNDGQVALVAVTGSRVENSDDSQPEADQRSQLAQRQSGYNASLEYQALDRYLRERADVEIHRDQLR